MSQVQQITDLVANDPHVAAVVPVIVTQLPIAGDGQSFAARLNVLGVPPQGALTLARPATTARCGRWTIWATTRCI